MKYNRPDKLIGLDLKQIEFAKANGLINYDIKVKERSVFSILKKNLFTFFNFISFAIGIILMIFNSYRNMLFLGVVFSNLVIGTYQEIKAKKINEKLNLLNKHTIKCKRDDKVINLYSNELALFDLVLLERGDQIPSDCEIEAGNCSVDESILTGENDEIPKFEGDVLLSGSFITEGNVIARIIRVYKDNYISSIQIEARNIKEPQSELLNQINKIIKLATIIIIPIGLILYFRMSNLGVELPTIVNLISAALIGMIPSGLVLLTSVALAVGVINLGKQNTLVNELSAIENLARIDTLCLDKTGTLTTGKMYLDKVYPINCDYDNAINEIKHFIMNNSDNNSTTNAIKNSIDFFESPVVKQEKSVSFNSSRKWSSVFYKGEYYCLGAFSCITNDFEIIKRCIALSELGKRVLLLGKTTSELSENSNLLNENITLICILSIADEIRIEAPDTIKYFYDQGVDIKVISGDDLNTIQNIALRVGILNHKSAIHNNKISEKIDVDKITIFGRVIPSNKKLIVNNLQNQGHIVAMCGDGVNDLPALKASDCSIAMGAGNDAVKSTSQIVLLDNNFCVLPSVVNEGRRVINNINLCASLFLNKTFLSALLSLICIAFSYSFPFQPIQLTLISSLTIGIPSFFYALEPNNNVVKDNFVSTVLKNSIPTAIAAGIAFISINIFLNLDMIRPSAISTIYTIVIAIILFTSLYAISRPLTKLRLQVISSLIIIFVLITVFFGNFFYFVDLQFSEVNVLIYTIFISFISFLILRKFIRKVFK